MKHVEGFPLKLLWNHVGDCKTRRLRDILRDDADTLIMDRGADIVVAQVGRLCFGLGLTRLWTSGNGQ